MIRVPSNGNRLNKISSIALLVLAGSLLAGCVGSKAKAPLATASTKPVSRAAILAQAQVLNEAYKKNPDDPAAAFRFARALEAMGSKKEGVAVLASTAERFPDDKMVIAAYGKSLLGVGRAEEAITTLKRARALDDGDWRVASALGMAHDQLKRYGEARKYYAQAVALAPEEPSIHNNAGLSFALDGDLKSAEKTLKIAAEMDKSNRRIRQNLALVLGLQGRFEEAQTISRMDLPGEKAEQNVAYLRSMLAQTDAWSQLAEIDKDKSGSKRRYKKVFAAVPARKPEGGARTSIGGPLILFGEPEPDLPALRVNDDRISANSTVSVEWPTGAKTRKQGGVVEPMLVAGLGKMFMTGKSSGVPR